MNRPCLTCGRPGPTSRCPTCQTAHQRQYDTGRPSTTARGYDKEHQQARARLLKLLPCPCAGCGRLLETRTDMVAAHVRDGDPRFGWIPTCRSCNERMKVRRAL